MKPAATASLSPSRRAWQRFKRNRLGYWSLVIFSVLVLLSLAAELLSNDKPLLVRYEGAVSYTHLDVYKRQVWRCWSFLAGSCSGSRCGASPPATGRS